MSDPKTNQSQHTPETHGYVDDRPPIAMRKAVVWIVVMVVIAAAVAIAGILPRVRAQKALADRTESLALADVTVEKPEAGAPTQELILPGNMFAYVDSPIYARTDGYLEKWYFDIGARVKKDRKSTRLNSSHYSRSRMPSSA